MSFERAPTFWTPTRLKPLCAVLDTKNPLSEPPASHRAGAGALEYAPSDGEVPTLADPSVVLDQYLGVSVCDHLDRLLARGRWRARVRQFMYDQGFQV